MDKNSLSHTTWECKYHLVFAPKYRRQVIYGQIKADVAEILSMLCKRKGIEIIEAECCKDHVHMLVRIPPKYSVSEIMGSRKMENLKPFPEKFFKMKSQAAHLLFTIPWHIRKNRASHEKKPLLAPSRPT